MKTITFDIEKTKAIENAVCEVFDCRISEIVSLKDTIVKKVVVYVLSKHYNVDKRVIGHQYQITYLYVPTVIGEIEYLIKTVPIFENQISKIYEKILDC